jgi:hypothetical protein
MDRDEALGRLREVQRIMEQTTLYTLLPGWPALGGGVLVLIGTVISVRYLGTFDLAAVGRLATANQVGFYAMWAAIAAIGVGLDLAFALLSFYQKGIPLPARPIRFALGAISLSILVAAAFTVRFITDNQLAYLAPLWMMLYGIGVYSAGLFSVQLPRLLGLAFVITGLVGLVLTNLGLLLVGIAFGGYHIAFGAIVLFRPKGSDVT